MDNDRPTRQEILDQYGWKPGEKEQLEREVAERARRNEETRAAEASRQQRETGQQRPAAANPTYGERAAAEKYWKNYIRAEINKNNEVVLGVIAKETGKAIVAEERGRKNAVEDLKSQHDDIFRRFHDHPRIEEFVTLRQQIAALRVEVAGLRAALEAAPSGRSLKAVG